MGDQEDNEVERIIEGLEAYGEISEDPEDLEFIASGLERRKWLKEHGLPADKFFEEEVKRREDWCTVQAIRRMMVSEVDCSHFANCQKIKDFNLKYPELDLDMEDPKDIDFWNKLRETHKCVDGDNPTGMSPCILFYEET